MVNTKNLQKLIRLAKKNGLSSLKTPEFELQFFPYEQAERKTKEKPPRVVIKTDSTIDPSAVMPSEDEMLMWATDSFDEMRAERSASETEHN